MTDPKPTRNKTGTPSPGSVVDGTYRLENKVASGGMGVVMRAHHIGMERDVAIKLMHAHVAEQEDFAQRFRREARVATLFNHPNITRVYDFGTTEDGIAYLVMELLEGEELQDLLDREGPLSLGRTIDISVEFLDGLAEAHSLEVMHRDLKPSNIFLSRTNRGREIVKLLDFGIAKLVEDESTTLTKTGMVAGTASYVSPERLLGAAETYAMDVYSAGLIILEMMMGRRVFDAETVAQSLLMQLKKEASIPETIARMDLGDVLRRATAKHPEDRYPDAAAFLDAFAEAAETAPRDLVLGPDDLPASPRDTTSSILRQVANGDGELDVLRRLEDRDDSSERLPSGELSTSDLLETLVYDTGGPDRSSTVVTPTRRSDIDHQAPRSSDRSEAPNPDASGEHAADPAISRSETALISSDSAREHEPARRDTTETGMGADFSSQLTNPRALVVATVVALVLGAGAYWLLASDNTSPAPESSTTSDEAVSPIARSEQPESKAAPSIQSRHSVTIRSDPAGASVYDGEQLLGETQFTLTVSRDSPPESLRFEREGFEPTNIDWPADPGDEITVELEPVEDDSDDGPTPPKPTRAESEPQRPTPKPRDTTTRRRKPATERAKSGAGEAKPEKDDNVDAVLDKYLPEP
ncbi:MAG: protein kinase domain-containing protein [Myxococcota bacterium]